MYSILTFLPRALVTPSAFYADPWNYFWNQLGHGLIVGSLVSLVLGWPGFLITVVGYIIWEAVQYFKYGAALSDCIEDFYYVFLGGLSIILTPWIFTIFILSLTEGTLWRWETKSRSKINV